MTALGRFDQFDRRRAADRYRRYAVHRIVAAERRLSTPELTSRPGTKCQILTGLHKKACSPQCIQICRPRLFLRLRFPVLSEAHAQGYGLAACIGAGVPGVRR